MAKCECCGERDATLTALSGAWGDLAGFKYSRKCYREQGFRGMFTRVRDRRAKSEQPSDTIPAPPPAAPECRECSRPERPIAATHGELCSYCAARPAMARADRVPLVPSLRNMEARERLAAADRKAQPRATAESCMLALPHPWEMQDD